ncbi:TCR/Tet family MFS transporter [Brevifollis gellanilyticus]|uniref:Tetracycline resistance MFS efflux pump n=1 Tax=Brevifollis gellanilyticus TaxID=748831 RepID=A0A512M3T5_9BACT|nr:TCR/Tet family MFS transporter [Brevifollis gellanilyticus]GEP41393.1 tetracycline resistance MFS efflux pump [Brevifollis gellanilyticus]
MSARRPAVIFIFITLVLDILGIGLVVPVLPKLVQHYQGGDVTAGSNVYGLLAALYALMQFLCAPLLGSLSDKYGRRPVILISLFGSAIDYFLIAFAPNLAWFVAARIVAGITAANYAAASAYIADVSPPEKRAANFGLIGAAFGIGFIIGPILGGLLAKFGGVKMPFFFAGALTLANWAYGWFVLPESLDQEHRRSFSWKRSNPVGALLALRRFPALLGLVVTYFIAVLAHQVYPSIWVLYTGYRYHWTELQTGLSLGAVGVMAGLVQGGLTKRVVGALGEKKTVQYGLALAIFLYAAYGFATQGWMVYICIFFGSLAGLVTPAVQSLMTQSVPRNEQGELQGALTSLSSVAGVAGPLATTRLFGYFVSDKAPLLMPGAPFFWSSLLMVLSLAIAVPSLKRIHKAPDVV